MSTDTIRNVAITGHSGTGKTTLVEQALFYGGRIPKPERVDAGKSVTDFTDEELERKISIHTALVNLKWQNTKINILDTPGSSDFVGEVVSALRVCETAAVVVGADVGVQIRTIQIWRRLESRKLPRIVFINKMEKEHADFQKVLDDLKSNFQVSFVPLTLPIGAGGSFQGVVDLIENAAYFLKEDGKEEKKDIPDQMSDQVEEYRQALIEAAAEGDDALMEKFFEEERLSEEDIRRGLSQAMREGKAVPVLCGSVLQGSGLSSFLNTVSNLCPSPAGVAEALEGDESQVITADAPTSALVFKTSIDQFSGKLSFVKVVTGTINPDSELINSRVGKKEKIGKLYICLGKKLEEIETLTAGDVGVLTKLSVTETCDTLVSSDQALAYKALKLPSPVHSVAISAVAKKDEDKLNQLLQRAATEDLTFQIHYNAETKETVISGMGEQHLDIILGKIRHQAKIEMETRVPQVAYRETIQKSAGAEYQHKKQTGGHGQYGKVELEIKPLPRGEQFKFVNAVVGGHISRGYIPGVEKGILEGMAQGMIAGYPVVDLEATVLDGKEHPVDSSEMAFKLAARGALKACLDQAKPILLEPVMSLNVFIDNQYLGDVLSDLSARRGRVLGQEPLGGGIQEVQAQVPQAELLRYSIDLRAITSGTASFEMEFSHYNPISGKVADDVVKAAAAAKKD